MTHGNGREDDQTEKAIRSTERLYMTSKRMNTSTWSVHPDRTTYPATPSADRPAWGAPASEWNEYRGATIPKGPASTAKTAVATAALALAVTGGATATAYGLSSAGEASSDSQQAGETQGANGTQGASGSENAADSGQDGDADAGATGGSGAGNDAADGSKQTPGVGDPPGDGTNGQKPGDPGGTGA